MISEFLGWKNKTWRSNLEVKKVKMSDSDSNLNLKTSQKLIFKLLLSPNKNWNIRESRGERT